MTTLVTIPGIMSDERTWAPVAAALAPRIGNVHVADTTTDDTLQGMAARALSQTGGNLIIIAHSMGGRVAMEMGRQAPERIRAMVLAGIDADGPGENEAAKREARISKANAGMEAYGRDWAPTVLSGANAKNDALVAKVRQMVEDCPPQVHARQNTALLHRPDAMAYIGDFPFPVLLIAGDEDHLCTETVLRAVAARIPDATCITIVGAGHLLPFEQPDELALVISQWLQEKAVY
ncbi:alpha/beta fold hydrolase [Roseinatronobacter alkalisoli]|uniref:Alpha/beta hydrolase n=1 Tax=Roseinatronobacter alkalisoli TaxID=3028235 RepID=A0ABT5TDS1_9RHOB|nr:alpha/beta hydrolase [Roseinatronobacter sp. HJB301]MDD7973114.1 alpha/beta hydrolase [Roseinatronobacter sp. HJB301]